MKSTEKKSYDLNREFDTMWSQVEKYLDKNTTERQRKWLKHQITEFSMRVLNNANLAADAGRRQQTESTFETLSKIRLS